MRAAIFDAILLCFLAACTKAVPAAAPLPPATPPDRMEFQQALNALHEFTPSGYTRAAGHFRRASELSPENCEYRLQLAQANLFLALEQRLNAENFRPAWEQGVDPQCAPGNDFSLRLQA